MNNTIKHRGPDDEGYVLFSDDSFLVLAGDDTSKEVWHMGDVHTPKLQISDSSDFDSKLAFGHRRLSILDLSIAGHQPMCDQNGRYWITYNGEIYNYLEIKAELQLLGHEFRTATDTEVIIAAYKQWGVSCQHKFNGMWSFALYDTHDRSLFLSRDRFGIKPLYYWIGPCGSVYFASEIKQFTTINGWCAILNGARAYDYLYYSITDHTDETLFRGVYRVLPGHHIYANTEELLKKATVLKLDQEKWYRPHVEEFSGSFDNAVDQFKAKFQDAVRLHLRSDVPVGSALSGGLDSSSIVMTVQSILSQNDRSTVQKTFSSCSTDGKYDEKTWMDMVVEATNVEAHFVYPDGRDIFNLTDSLVWHMDEPYDSQSAFLGYHVFGEAEKCGVKVVLNGQGADEYLSCYSELKNLRQRNLLKKRSIRSHLREIGNLGEAVDLIKSSIYSSLTGGARMFAVYWSKRHRTLNNVINVRLLVGKKSHPYDVNNFKRDDALEISRYQLFCDPLPRYLRWEDRNSMAHSIEARVPFLDYRLVEFTNSLPIGFLDAPFIRKRLLVESMKGMLPEKVRLRKDKKGFVTPETRWFQIDYPNQFLAYFEAHVDYSKGVINPVKAREYLLAMQSGKIPFDTTYWRIILFCVWMKKFSVELENDNHPS